MTPLYQAIVAICALVSIVFLAAMRVVNPDAAIAIVSTILGYVFGVAVPVPASPFARLGATVHRDDGDIQAGSILTVLLIVLVFILIVRFWPF